MGNKYRIAAQVAVDQINELGGIKNLGGAKLVLVLGDGGAAPDQAATEAERLITVEKVDALLTVWPTAMAVSDIAERYKTMAMSALTVPEELTERGYKYIFRTCPGANEEAQQNVYQIMKSAEEAGLPPPRTMYIMNISDDCAIDMVNWMFIHAEEAGIEIIGHDVVDFMAPTFVPQILKIERLKPDVMYECHYTGDAIIMYREMMERETYIPYGVSSWGGGIEDPHFYRALPLQAYQYTFAQENGDSVPQTRPWYPYLNEKIRAYYGMNWEDCHLIGNYGVVWIIKEALERVEWSDDLATFRTNLRDTISNIHLTRENAEKVTTPDGTTYIPALDPIMLWDGIAFDEDGDALPQYELGVMSQNIGGIRWPMYPEKYRLPNSPSVVLPMPPWDERG